LAQLYLFASIAPQKTMNCAHATVGTCMMASIGSVVLCGIKFQAHAVDARLLDGVEIGVEIPRHRREGVSIPTSTRWRFG
jgi:hypothetical protein